MKKPLLAILLTCCFFSAFADHLKGGFFTYEYMGQSPNNASMLRYHIKLTVYMVCTAQSNPGQLSPSIPFTIFDAGTGQIYQNLNVSIATQARLEKTTPDECITGDQSVCYYVVTYDLSSVDLPDNEAGYVVSYQRCCRIIDIRNMPSTPPSSTYGNTYSISIPGHGTPHNAQHNSSPQFLVNDTAVVCGGSHFEVPFIATDADGDSLAYGFCDAWTGGGQANTPSGGPNTPTPNPASPPPYFTIDYAAGFSGSSPLGSTVTINPRTGIISGIAPSEFGEYVVTVCVFEFRNGDYIASSRKELHLKVGDCGQIKATLNPQFVNCKGFDVSFYNLTNGGVQTFFWDFGLPNQTNDTSNLAAPTFVYPDTGTYQIKLVVNKGKGCADSAIALAKVYPGFFSGFTYAGICQNKPTRFFDTTRTVYGTVNGWSWNFGEPTPPATSTAQNPSHTYPTNGTYHVQFIVSSSKGCIDTVYKDVLILDKPPMKAIPKDTLICNGDNVMIGASGTGAFTWTGPNIISDGNTATPTVQPTSTSNYIVELNDNGCVNRDTMQVRVVNFVTLQMPADTVICATDSVRLHAANTNALHFTWSPAAGISNPTLPTPMALPVNTPSIYQLRATIGHCEASGDFRINLVPYPTADAGIDQTICFNRSVQLHASMVGSAFTWTPAATLDNPASLDPIASPHRTTTYIFSVTATDGCPKPKRDTVVVTVLPQIFPFAGHDTAVVVGQPLQLQATGGIRYVWSPGTGLNRTDIPNPMGIYDGNLDSVRYKVLVYDVNSCSDSAYMTVRVFRTQAQIFVPTAFTPNGDGLNDYFRPIAVGISRFDYFKIFNRWGQLVYSSTSVESAGWDGKVNGKEQATASFVWIVKGLDYTGKAFFAKGTVTLVR